MTHPALPVETPYTRTSDYIYIDNLRQEDELLTDAVWQAGEHAPVPTCPAELVAREPPGAPTG
ncbi:hypothetical protein [Streptomyces zhihengii]|uniref:Uncharacterized protein n=1 Tax=Streptomyces zhihengii TaxID=1818004 RepID=A0ABS2V5E1_9ACTN|nr:hypothetical protein [Streptomyces zhihengii]MBM9624751.1 hypothetical protein [Streptomyces zhihengii]